MASTELPLLEQLARRVSASDGRCSRIDPLSFSFSSCRACTLLWSESSKNFFLTRDRLACSRFRSLTSANEIQTVNIKWLITNLCAMTSPSFYFLLLSHVSLYISRISLSLLVVSTALGVIVIIIVVIIILIIMMSSR